MSPITAITGSTQLTQNMRAANTKLFPIEISMGIFHALSGKKNVFLMTCSFAISIMIFLCLASAAVVIRRPIKQISRMAIVIRLSYSNNHLMLQNSKADFFGSKSLKIYMTNE